MTNNIIALMPYLAIINGEKRTNDIMNFGLKSITHLPRSTFKGSRVQTCILEMQRHRCKRRIHYNIVKFIFYHRIKIIRDKHFSMWFQCFN